MQPTALTVTEANRAVVGYLSTVLGKQIDPNPAFAENIGCQRNPVSLMTEGPPWLVRRIERIHNPTQDQVDGALSRLESLAAQGFTRQPWPRPDPEPPGHASYRNGQGYLVSVSAETTTAEEYLLTVFAVSPPASES